MAKKISEKSVQNDPIDHDFNDNLRCLYNHTYDETKHYRTYEWQITVWSITLLGAFYYLLNSMSSFPANIPYIKTFTLILTVFFGISSLFNILHCHLSLTKNRRLILRIENHFLFHHKLIGNPPEQIFPKKYVKKPTIFRGWFHILILSITIISVTIFVCHKVLLM